MPRQRTIKAIFLSRSNNRRIIAAVRISQGTHNVAVKLLLEPITRRIQLPDKIFFRNLAQRPMAVRMRAQLHACVNQALDFLLIHMRFIAHLLVDNKERALSIIFLQQRQHHAVIIFIAVIKAQRNILVHALALLQALRQLNHRYHRIALLLQIAQMRFKKLRLHNQRLRPVRALIIANSMIHEHRRPGLAIRSIFLLPAFAVQLPRYTSASRRQHD